MKRELALKAIGGVTIVLLFITTMVTLAFFITSFVYARTAIELPAFVVQIINALLGLFFSFLTFGAIGYFTRSRAHSFQLGVFGPIIDAMDKISKGDFTVRVENKFEANEPVNALVKSVNTMAQELNQMEAMRQEFISNVSHEIQSPLTSIRGFARALQNNDVSAADRTHYLSIIETESMRLSKLSDNLLALAALEAENNKFEPRPYPLDMQIRDVILACEPQWSDKKIDMELSVEPLTITADPDLLNQVWVNLIYNSIKFTPSGGRICIDLHPHADKIEFHIADTGIGIAEAEQSRIFERFYKADESRERAKGSSGLGLAIAKTIVEMHHGTIGVSSQLGAGATFTVTLPITQ